MKDIINVENSSGNGGVTDHGLLSVEKKREENRREDKKAGKRFLIITTVSCLGGMLMGAFGMGLVSYLKATAWDFVSFSKLATECWIEAGSYLLICSNIIILPLLWASFSKQKKLLKEWDGENESVYEKIDKKLSLGMTISSALMIFDMLTYGVAFYGLIENIKIKSAIFFIDLIFFIGSTACIMLYQKALVNLLKELNPEKQGSVYDTKFRKKWMESCDEAERQKIGEASYATCSFMNIVYEAVSVIFMIAGFFFPIGVLPITTVCLLWLAQVVFYSVKASKM